MVVIAAYCSAQIGQELNYERKAHRRFSSSGGGDVDLNESMICTRYSRINLRK